VNCIGRLDGDTADAVFEWDPFIDSSGKRLRSDCKIDSETFFDPALT